MTRVCLGPRLHLLQNFLETVLAVLFTHPKYGPRILFVLFAIVPVLDAICNIIASKTNTRWDDMIIGAVVRNTQYPVLRASQPASD